MKIDQNSVVSNDFSFNIHLRLVEIFGRQDDKPFSGLTVMTTGDCFNSHQYGPDHSICTMELLGKTLNPSGGNLK